jgi:DNA invertase Pin-like site-specific DNA recombinase
MKAFGYVRCSTSMQSTEGVTLQNQSQRIADWCKTNGHELVKVYEDAGLSGSKVVNRGVPQQRLCAKTQDEARPDSVSGGRSPCR